MIAVISPAKTLDFSARTIANKATQPVFREEARILAEVLKGYSPARLARLMSINPKLAQLNFERYQEWNLPFTPENAKQALLSFRGDVFLGIDAPGMTPDDLDFAQGFLRILSGLYGVLKPLDLMQAYRLEMGTRLRNSRGEDLYGFWGRRLTDSLNRDLASEKNRVLVNLASNEYFNAIDAKAIEGTIITPAFKDFSNGKYRFLSYFAKQARGMMAAYLIRNRVESTEKLCLFDSDGYRYSEEHSTPTAPVFLRKKAS